MIVPELVRQAPSSLNGQSPGGQFACVEFSSGAAERSAASICTGLPPARDAKLYEVWRSDSRSPVAGRHGGWSYVCDDEALFGWSHPFKQNDVEEQTYQNYQTLLELLGLLDFPHLVKVWHYIPYLCEEHKGVSRYRLFCRGRGRAAGHRLEHERLNAATVIGTRASQGVFYFLAARNPTLSIENPRQTKACEYPIDSAAERPLFTRAVLLNHKRHAYLYISGTAGILGHASQNLDDVEGQAQTAASNVLCLLEQAARLDSRFEGLAKPIIQRMNFFCVNRADEKKIRRGARELLQSIQSPVFFLGDVCRPELLVEIDALLLGRSADA